MQNEKITHIDLFSGIGGFALATEMVWDNVEHIFCDNEPFAKAIIRKHWPNATIYGDIRTLTSNPRGEEQRGVSDSEREEIPAPGKCYILTGGFPCQPFSHAGIRRGTSDDRYLWPEMLRVIREFKPRWVIAENVAGLLSIQDGMVFEQVCSDLEAEDYEVQAFVIPACAVGAPHRRDRVWIVGHSKYDGRNGTKNRHSDTTGNGSLSCWKKQLRKPERPGSARKEAPTWNEYWSDVAARLCTMDDGLSNGLARPRGWRNAALKGAGNAIVPQVAAQIMHAIKEIDT